MNRPTFDIKRLINEKQIQRRSALAMYNIAQLMNADIGVAGT